jgi:tetratricopeptide (TPR) repeat protein
MMKVVPQTDHEWRRVVVTGLGVPLVAVLVVKSLLYTLFVYRESYALADAVQSCLNMWMAFTAVSLLLFSCLLFIIDRSLSRYGFIMLAFCILGIVAMPVVTTEIEVDEDAHQPVPELRPAVVPPELLVPGPAARPHILTLQLLQRELEAMEERDGNIPAEMARQVEALLYSGVDADERMQAALLLVAIHDQRGEGAKAFNAFARCLTASEELYGVAHAVSLAQSRASNVERKENGYTDGQAYYDMIIARYPKTPAAGFATIKASKPFVSIGRHDLAIEHLRRFVANAPENPWAHKAAMLVTEHLFNTWKKEQACEELLAMCGREETPPALIAAMHYRLALYRSNMGAAHLPAALASLQLILAEYPDSQYASRAESRIQELSK